MMRASSAVWLTAAAFVASFAQGATHGAIPRAPDGHPSFEGTWTNATITPFERPVELGTKAFYAPGEMREVEANGQARMQKVYRPDEGVGTDNEAFFEKDRHWLPTRQTSLVMEPADGRVPLRPELLSRSDAHSHTLDSYETMNPMERCVSLGATILFPKFINNGYEIVQTGDQLLVHTEMMNDVRLIPLKPRPAPSASVTEWAGISRGHWEGDTLVVETTNFNDRGRILSSLAQMAPRNFPQTKQLHTVERFTLRDANTIDYRITFDDPAVFTKPWTVSFPFTRSKSYRLYEFACHEGNIDLEITLQGARVEEQRGH
jgi:hypothetical protein